MNKSIVITGATKGIGLAIAKLFVQQNYTIAFCGRSLETVQQTKLALQQLNATAIIHGFVADLSQQQQCNSFCNALLNVVSHIDILVNNAGIYLPGTIHQQATSVMETLMNTNFYSAYYVTKNLLPQFIANGKGHIFNISSVAGMQPYHNGGAYSISKYALSGFSKNLREELKDKGIRVTTVYPGATYTTSWEGSGISPERIMPSDDIASLLFNAYQLSHRSVIEDIVVRPQLGDV